MSIALMTLAWKSALPAGRKMVLLALCDNANDQGECYPSIPMLAQKCSMGERTVQQHISDMESVGIVAREMRMGRSNIYHIDPSKFDVATPADSAPRKICTPQNSHPTPAEFAPITIIESSEEPSRNHQKRAKIASFVLPTWIPVDAWDGYIDMRKKKRKEPTDRALGLLVAELEKLREAGHDVAAVLDKSTLNGWTDVYPPKVEQQPRASPTAVKTQRQLQADNQAAYELLFGKKGEVIDV